MITGIVNEVIQSETFIGWMEQYTEFTGEASRTPEITEVLYYQYPDQEADGYLVNIAANVGFFVDEENQAGAVEESVRLYIDRESSQWYDHITLNAGSGSWRRNQRFL